MKGNRDSKARNSQTIQGERSGLVRQGYFARAGSRGACSGGLLRGNLLPRRR